MLSGQVIEPQTSDGSCLGARIAQWITHSLVTSVVRVQILVGICGRVVVAHPDLSRIVRKPDFCLCENKAADQLRLYRPVCVGPCRKPRRPVFSRRGSFGGFPLGSLVSSTTFEHKRQHLRLLFFFFFNSVLRPFQDYFSSYETGQSVGGRKRENPEKNHLAHPQAELGLSHMWPVRGSIPHQTQR